jgi:hypothetical protein
LPSLALTGPHPLTPSPKVGRREIRKQVSNLLLPSPNHGRGAGGRGRSESFRLINLGGAENFLSKIYEDHITLNEALKPLFCDGC